MLYDMVHDCFQSLANQWRDLGEAFRRLAESVEGRSTTRSGALVDLALICDNDPDDEENGRSDKPDGYRQELEAEFENDGLRSLRRAGQLIPYAIRRLEENERRRIEITSSFNAIFGLPDNTEK